jgi:hypothetical protein
MLEIIDAVGPLLFPEKNEDEYFCHQTVVPMHKPTSEQAETFSVETIFHPSPFGVHNCYTHLAEYEWYFLSNKYPELNKLKELNIIYANPNVAIFTIIYKTYKNDIEWLEYSLLSLKKYLDFSNIYEIIIYSHDIVRSIDRHY